MCLDTDGGKRDSFYDLSELALYFFILIATVFQCTTVLKLCHCFEHLVINGSK